ncbi:Protein MOR1 [Camellia lanceoleosa]|uniref:Protein MOR1 n=1 Tax=Camellia lanceoleosa TaxID=1840588 RepID=A0ACC0FF96_9ERIC|nr:Protein MOR1 [Camellia lanceoleosa]
MDEFRCYVRLVFPTYLMSTIDEGNWPYEKGDQLTADYFVFKKRFFAPIDMKISHQDDASESNIHGHDVLRISELFAKLCTILKIAPVTHEDENGHLPSVLEDYTNIFNPCSTSSQDHTIDEDVSVWTDNRRKVDNTTKEKCSFISYSEFGAKIVPPKRILKMLPELFAHQDQNVRASSKGLTLELCRWIGKEPVKSILFEKMQDTMGPDMLGATICARMVNGSKPTRLISASDSGQGAAPVS